LNEGKNMAMSRPQPINVFLVATVSAAIHGGAAVLFAPMLSVLLLVWGQVPARLQAEDGMVFAVLAPILGAAFGFVAGAVMALAHNMFAQGQRKLTVEIYESRRVQAASASLSNVA
jgi:hypothetical protein